MKRLQLDRTGVLTVWSAILSNLVSNIPAVLVFKPFVSQLIHPQPAGSKHAPVEQKIYGTVRSLPEGMIGIWIVDGKQIDVTDGTRIEEEYGKATVGAYVEIEGTASGETLSARKIEVKSDRPRHGDRRSPRE